MILQFRTSFLAIGGLVAVAAMPVAAQTPSPAPSSGAQPNMSTETGVPRTTFKFQDEVVAGPPKSFAAIVGHWTIAAEGENRVLAVDGRAWKEGQVATGIAEQSRALYGERYAEFLDNVKAYAYYPYAIAQGVDDFRDGEISVRFKAISGRIDQAAGILFNVKPNGNYLTVRANPLENNLVLWKFEKGRRDSVKWIRDTPTPTRQWHEMRVVVRGGTVKGYLNGKLYLTHTLPAPVSGKVGLWSKADSYVYFDNFTVSPVR